MAEMTVTVGGGELWVDDSGGDRPPLVLLHPYVGDSRIWDPLLPRLSETYRVIRYDARGYGRSPAPTEPYTLLSDLVAVLDRLGLERVPLVGCGRGGGSALGLAVAAPQRVSALVLLCPGIPGYQTPADPEADAAFDRARHTGPDAVAEVALGLWARAGRTPQVVAQLRSAARAWLAEEDLVRPDPPVFSRLGEITVPTSLLVGDMDLDWLIESNRIAARRIPGCMFEEVRGVDHLPPLRVPERVLRMIGRTVATVVP